MGPTSDRRDVGVCRRYKREQLEEPVGIIGTIYIMMKRKKISIILL
jgi:hypothetical protein